MKTLILFILSLIFISCSSSQETTKESEKDKLGPDEVYVFDDVDESTNRVTKEDVKKLSDDIDKTIPEGKKNDYPDNPPARTEYQNLSNLEKSQSIKKFYLQLGAFSTLKRAENFIREINSSLSFPVSVVYNSKNSLYTVRSSPFNTRAEVEKVREGFWKANMFKDSFIVTE